MNIKHVSNMRCAPQKSIVHLFQNIAKGYTSVYFIKEIYLVIVHVYFS